jgi:hypothetical protein
MPRSIKREREREKSRDSDVEGLTTTQTSHTFTESQERWYKLLAQLLVLRNADELKNLFLCPKKDAILRIENLASLNGAGNGFSCFLHRTSFVVLFCPLLLSVFLLTHSFRVPLNLKQQWKYFPFQ